MLPLWLTVQMIALALAAGRVPLYARIPTPIERQATVEMLVVQLAVASLLFPSLLSGRTRWAWAAASTWPMLFLAGLLGGEPIQRVAAAAGYLTGWLFVLMLWARVLNHYRQPMIGVLFAALWTIGGPVLLYLHAEFAGAASLWPPNHGNIPYAIAGGPIWAALYHLRARHLFLFSDIPTAALGIAAVIVIKAEKRQRTTPN